MTTNQIILLKLPLLIIFWWFSEAPFLLGKFLIRLGWHFSQVLSLPLLFKTFFVPWKNENRKGYVAIARGIGMTVKLSVIFADLIILLMYFIFATSLEIIFLLTPFLSLYLLGGPWIK